MSVNIVNSLCEMCIESKEREIPFFKGTKGKEKAVTSETTCVSIAKYSFCNFFIPAWRLAKQM